MTYRFAGFFADVSLPFPESFPVDAVYQEVMKPFEGIGVRFNSLIGQSPPLAEVQTLAQQIGLDDASRWLYLTYDCWGGRIDDVYGIVSKGESLFGPVEDSNGDSVEVTYIKLMHEFGLTSEAALNFEPFQRGYWDSV